MKTNLKRALALAAAALTLLALASCKRTPSLALSTLSANLNSIYEDGSLKQYYVNNADHFIQNVASLYGMNETDARSFSSGEGNWGVYALRVIIDNYESFAYTFSGFEAENFSVDGVWLCSESANGEISIPGGVTDENFSADVIINFDKVSVAELYTAVAGMKLNIVYYLTPADDEEDPPEDSKKRLTVINNIQPPADSSVEPSLEIEAKRSDITDGSAFLTAYKNSAIAFSNESKLFGMDSETAAHVIAQDSEWSCYILNIDVENKSENDLTVYSVAPEGNGESGVWLCSVSQYGEFSIAPGETQQMPITVLVDPDALGDAGFQDVIADMKITLTYSQSTVIDNQGNESLALTKTVDVK